MIALNAKKKWYKRFEGEFTEERVLAWMDSVKMGEGKKFVVPSEEEIKEMAGAMGKKVVEDPEVNGMRVDEEGNVVREEPEETKREKEEVRGEGSTDEGIKEVFGDEPEQKHDEL